MTDLKVIRENDDYQIFVDYIDNQPLQFIKNKRSGEVRLCTEDGTCALDIVYTEDLMCTSSGLDAVCDWMERNPGKDIFGKCGSGALFEEFPVIE